MRSQLGELTRGDDELLAAGAFDETYDAAELDKVRAAVADARGELFDRQTDRPLRMPTGRPMMSSYIKGASAVGANDDMLGEPGFVPNGVDVEESDQIPKPEVCAFL